MAKVLGCEKLQGAHLHKDEEDQGCLEDPVLLEEQYFLSSTMFQQEHIQWFEMLGRNCVLSSLLHVHANSGAVLLWIWQWTIFWSHIIQKQLQTDITRVGYGKTCYFFHDAENVSIKKQCVRVWCRMQCLEYSSFRFKCLQNWIQRKLVLWVQI